MMKARIGPGACREEARSLRLRSPCVEAGGVGHPCRRGAAQEVRGCGPLGVAPAAPARRRKLQAQADRGRPEVRTTDQSSCNPPSSQEKLARLNRSGQTRSQPKPAWSPRVQRGAALIRIDGAPADGLLRLLPGCSEWRYVADRTACRAGAEYRPCSKDPDTIAFGVVDPRVLLHTVLFVPSAIVVLHQLVEFTTLNGA
jgi:hypothetical protein